jgi:radical SAM protein with 4Fe4S-binding SPASM domain
MHHYNENKFNQITGNPNAFNMTLTGIYNTIEVLGADSLNVNMVVTTDTVEEIKKMSDFLYEKGVKSMSVSLVSTSGQAALNNLLCTYTDLEKAYEQMIEVQKIMPISFVGGLPFCSLPSKYDPDLVSMSNVCDAGITQVVIGPNGGIRPCVEWPEEAGNIFEEDIVDVWQSSKVFENIREFKNTPTICRNCKQVPHCHGGCRASALAATKDICGFDPMMKPVEV